MKINVLIAGVKDSERIGSQLSGGLRRHQPGASIFLTIALTDVGKRSLVERIGPLRDAVRVAMGERLFGVDARVVLPDHLHAI